MWVDKMNGEGGGEGEGGGKEMVTENMSVKRRDDKTKSNMEKRGNK